MFGFNNRSNVARIIAQIDNIENNKEILLIKPKDRMKYIMQKIDSLYKSQKEFSKFTKEILDINAKISAFDIEIQHSGKGLITSSKSILELSETNYAVIEECTASLNDIGSAIENITDIINIMLTTDATTLLENNTEVIDNIESLNISKDKVHNATEEMENEITSLINLSYKVDTIVESVQQVAEQTNLLALNASIEAARAGEKGRGFSIIAEEIRNLAEDTKNNLTHMTSFVSDIKSSASKSNESMKNSIEHTTEMNKSIDRAHELVTKNTGAIKTAYNKIESIAQGIEEINASSKEIQGSFEVTAKSAESLSDLSRDLHNASLKNQQISKVLDEADRAMSKISEQAIAIINTTSHSLTVDDLIGILSEAEHTHNEWLEQLNKCVETHSILPLQTDDHKCKFGHYYHTIHIVHSDIKQHWLEIDQLHLNVHHTGKQCLDYIAKEQYTEALNAYQNCKVHSEKLKSQLNNIRHLLKQTKLTTNKELFTDL